MTRKWTKWVPAAAVPAIIAAGVIVAPLGATAAGDLPEKSPRELLDFAAAADVDAFAGTVEQTSELGLPDLSALGSTDSPDATGSDSDLASMLDLATGSHTARVWVDGAERARLQVLDPLAERNLIRSGDDVWFYSSTDQTATHVTLPDVPEGVAADARAEKERYIESLDRSPAELADELYAAVDESTEISVGSESEVAGRAAYELRLDPDDADTLVDSVSVSIDAETGLALAVEVRAVGAADPVFRSAFTEITLETPDASVFEFTPPEGATVTEKALPTGPSGDRAVPETGGDESGAPTVIGSGWSTVVELGDVEVPAELAESPLFDTATTAVDGGRAFSTALVSVLLTDDGRVLAGAVPVSVLQAAAAG
ncbi:LolA family protein [Marisediminicola sp. LYQ85]|uniref:LolA family protein n=1 Tax=Marisediminicola sp. LYQ85 TaxID=3391062 RepID=UPI0039835BD4